MKKLTIGLIGNPNSGKTTLFNQLTGSRQRVGNWAGVTVERKEGQFSTTDHQVTLVDLPGTYSLTTISSQTSLDEQIACHYILSGDADLLINVVDASNLERNLYLTLQLLELGIPCIVALNMLDIAEKQNIRIEIDALSARLGCPVIPLVSTRGRGIEALKLAIDRYKANENVELVHYAQPLLNEADSLAKVMPSDIPLKQRRWLGLQMLEGDIYSRAYAGEASQHLDAALARLRNEMDDPALHIADARYQCIAAICDVVSNTLYTAENIQDEEFNPAEFNLGEELFSAVDETWQSLKDTFSLSVLMNPIEASKGDGEMGTGAMGVMDQKFGSAAAAYSYLIFVLLYVPCISVMGAIARESSRGWMGFSILWGLNIAYSLATLFYQVASYSQHPTYSLVCILAVILFNIVVIGLLRRARSRVDVELLATRKSVSSCCAASTTGDCH